MTNRAYRKWAPIIDRAAEIVGEYDTGVTLRQLHYRLVAEAAHGYRNEHYDYSRLSRLTAERRREGSFPDLIDPTRRIREPLTFTSSDQAHEWLQESYRRDRTEGQPVSVYLGVEKHGMAAQLVSWFAHFGVPILTLGGWASQTFTDDVARHIQGHDRPAVFLYAGDFDPSGWFIGSEFVQRVGLFDVERRLALHPDQIDAFGLVESIAPAKVSDDPRAAAFVDLFGDLRQVELEAINPATMRSLYADALGEYWDDAAYQAALDFEAEDRAEVTSWREEGR